MKCKRTKHGLSMREPKSRLPEQLRKRVTRKLSVSITCLVLLAGCRVTPVPLSDDEQAQIIQDDRIRMFVEQAPITAPITLGEALERALTYNLDNRLMMMEQAIRAGQLDLSRFDLWPKLLLSSGYNTRSNENLSLSRDSLTDVLTTNPFLSQDRNIANANLGLSWNILDFGVSYYQARQNADQVFIAEQRRRSVVNQIIQQVRSSYWRAATAEPLYEQVVPILAEARQALRDSRETEAQRLVPPLESLQYQKGLVEVIRELDALEIDLAIAKAEMSALMGLPPGTHFSLALPEEDAMIVPELDWTIEEMELMALTSRPELVEERYQQRISVLETKKALLSLFPSITFNTGGNYDSNSYLLEQNWAEASANLSVNLMGLANAGAVMRNAKANEQLAELRRMALSMAALSQIHVSYQQYLRAGRSYEQALVLDDIERRIFENVNNSANNQSQSTLQRIRAQLAAVYAEVNRFRAYSEVQNALANLYVSTGIDLQPDANNPGLLTQESREDTEDLVLAPVDQVPVVESTLESPILAVQSELSDPIIELDTQPEQGVDANLSEEQIASATAVLNEPEPEPPTAAVAVARVAATLAAVTPVTETEELQQLVEAWVASWESREADSYFSFYHEDFYTLYHRSREEWRNSKLATFSGIMDLEIGIEDMIVARVEGDEAEIEITLHYNAMQYEDITRKQLRLRREQGRWRIWMERNLVIDIIRA